VNDQLNELRAMTAELLAAMRALAPLPETFRAHADRIDRALGALDARLDLVERAQIKLEATIGTLKLDEQEQRIKSLEDDRIRVKAWTALIAFLGSIGAFFAGRFWSMK
jgi:hypothetical protein